jgi:hypothetical protein
MGILLTSSLSWSSAHSKYVSQAQRALFAIKANQRPFGYFSIVDSFKIFDSMVKPILCYASQIWGYEYVDMIESIYTCIINFIKCVLYLRRTINTCMFLGECGRSSLCTTYYKNCIRFWCNLLSMPSKAML